MYIKKAFIFFLHKADIQNYEQRTKQRDESIDSFGVRAMTENQLTIFFFWRYEASTTYKV